MLGGRDRPVVPERGRQAALDEGAKGVHQDFAQLYPALAGMGIDCRREGLFATTPDGRPTSGRIAATRVSCSRSGSAGTA